MPYKIIISIVALYSYSLAAVAGGVVCPDPSDDYCTCNNGHLFSFDDGEKEDEGLNPALCPSSNKLSGAIANAMDAHSANDVATPPDNETHATGSYGTYKQSFLPEWEYAVFLKSNAAESNMSIDSNQNRYRARSVSHQLGLSLIKDELRLASHIGYSINRGQDVNEGSKAKRISLNTSVGYDILTENKNGLNLTLFGSFGLSNSDFGDNIKQDRFSSNIGLNVGALTPIGYLGSRYSYGHDGNFNNDIEMTGSDKINSHQLSLIHTIPIARHWLLNTELSTTKIESLNANGDEQPLSYKLGVLGKVNNQWSGGFSWFDTISNGESKGISAEIRFLW